MEAENLLFILAFDFSSRRLVLLFSPWTLVCNYGAYGTVSNPAPWSHKGRPISGTSELPFCFFQVVHFLVSPGTSKEFLFLSMYPTWEHYFERYLYSFYLLRPHILLFWFYIMCCRKAPLLTYSVPVINQGTHYLMWAASKVFRRFAKTEQIIRNVFDVVT